MKPANPGSSGKMAIKTEMKVPDNPPDAQPRMSKHLEHIIQHINMYEEQLIKLKSCS